MFIPQTQSATKAVGRQFKPVGPVQRAAFGERAREIGGVGRRPGHHGIAGNEIGGGPECRSAVREYELQAVVALHSKADES